MALTIAVGFVVDDAIVVVENIYRHVEHGEPPFKAALKGSREIGFTVLSISCSLIAVFIPLLLMGGIIGRLFREFALTVTASIVVSAVVSLTLAPMMCSRFMHREPETHGRVYRVIEGGFNAMLAFYRRTLDIVLRHQAITLGVFFATMALTVVMAIEIPKGFFPIQDTGIITGVCRGGAGHLARGDDAADAGARRRHPARSATSRLRLADRLDRQRADRQYRPFLHRAQAARRAHAQLPRRSSTACGRSSPRSRARTLFLQPAQDINVGARIARGSFQYTLQDANIAELNEWSQKLLDKLRTLPQLADVTSDLLANAPKLQITINRDQASRFGISPQLIDDTLNDAFGQRQITQYFTQLKTYFVILEILPELQKDLSRRSTGSTSNRR